METAYLTTGGLVTHWGYLVFGTRSLRLKVFVTCVRGSVGAVGVAWSTTGSSRSGTRKQSKLGKGQITLILLSYILRIKYKTKDKDPKS